MVIEFGSYQLDDEATRVDRDAVWSFLSSQAYWGRWRTRQDVERQLDTAWRVVGVYDAAKLVRVMIDCGPGVSFRWTLHTADAHGLYEQFGFIRPDHTYLERIPRDRLAQKSRLDHHDL